MSPSSWQSDCNCCYIFATTTVISATGRGRLILLNNCRQLATRSPILECESNCSKSSQILVSTARPRLHHKLRQILPSKARFRLHTQFRHFSMDSQYPVPVEVPAEVPVELPVEVPAELPVEVPVPVPHPCSPPTKI